MVWRVNIGRAGFFSGGFCPCNILLAHSKNELMQWRGVRGLSVRPSVNFCANRFFSQANGRIATKLAQDGLQVSEHPGVLKVKVKVKGHVIRALFWILGMSYSVIAFTSPTSADQVEFSIHRKKYDSRTFWERIEKVDVR